MEVGRNVDNEDVKKPVPQSLRITAKEVSDYYTKAEYTAFMKPKSGKEKKMRRKKKEEDLEPLEELEDSGAGADGTFIRICKHASMSDIFKLWLHSEYFFSFLNFFSYALQLFVFSIFLQHPFPLYSSPHVILLPLNQDLWTEDRDRGTATLCLLLTPLNPRRDKV